MAMTLELNAVEIKKESVFIILVKIVVLVIFATLLTGSSAPLKALSFVGIIAILFHTLSKLDFFSFLIQILIGNHFVYLQDFGGLFNLTAIVALLMLWIFKSGHMKLLHSSLSYFVKLCLLALFIIQLLSIINNGDFQSSKKIVAVFSYFMVLALFYFASSVKITDYDFSRFLFVLSFCVFYMFIASLNQRLLIFTANYPFLPVYDPNIEFDFKLTRSAGTLLNYESYAEYSLSIIALMFPAVITGSLKKLNKRLHLVAIATIIIGIGGIVLSGTRSSILLLPFVILLTFFYGTKIKSRYSLGLIGILIFSFVVNSVFGFIDTSIFLKRSDDINVKNLSLNTVVSGEEINRGSVFTLAFERIDKKAGLLGLGYFPGSKEYQKVHFGIDTGNTDYHNLYLSLVVVTGFIGVFVFVLVFVSLITKAIKVYQKVKYQDSLQKDLLLGFTLLFIFFLINEFKIQFYRFSNYFMLIFLLLGIYASLIRQLSAFGVGKKITIAKPVN